MVAHRLVVKHKPQPPVAEPIRQFHILGAAERSVKATCFYDVVACQRRIAGVKLPRRRIPLLCQHRLVLLLQHRLFPQHPGVHVELGRGEHGAKHHGIRAIFVVPV